MQIGSIPCSDTLVAVKSTVLVIGVVELEVSGDADKTPKEDEGVARHVARAGVESSCMLESYDRISSDICLAAGPWASGDSGDLGIGGASLRVIELTSSPL